MADREWMYTGFKDKTEEWVKGTGHFLEQAFGLAAKGAIRVWCPCSKCKNDKKKERRPMYHDIWKNDTFQTIPAGSSMGNANGLGRRW